MRRLLAGVLGIAMGGCALNGILEVEMTLPYDGTTEARPFAIVQIDDEMPEAWNENWDDRPAQVFQIDGTAEDPCADVERSCNTRFSVSSTNTGLERMYMKITFCGNPDCTTPMVDGNPPLYAFVIEQPFYQGCVTTWNPNRDPFPVAALAEQPPSPVADYRDPSGACVCTGDACTRDDPAGWRCPPAEPPITDVIERCEIGRFGDEGDETGGWCLMTGQHFCEAR